MNNLLEETSFLHALQVTKTRVLGHLKEIITFPSDFEGALNVLLTNPLWVVNSRLKMQNVNEKDQMISAKYRGLIDGLIKIYSREGLSALWNGTSASLILISNPAIKVKAGKTRSDYGQI